MRESGIILHISSLPGKYGIGTLGKEAYNFADFLKASGVKYWQVLPLGPTGYGDSPYQSFSAFAGNPYLIDLEFLAEANLLSKEDLEMAVQPEDKVDYQYQYKNKRIFLRRAFENSKGILDKGIYEFREENSEWVEYYGLFMSLKEKLGGIPLSDWPSEYQNPIEALNLVYEELKDEIDYHIFTQYIFFRQYMDLKAYVNSIGIEIIGDLPIYVAKDSADFWTNRELFMLDENGNSKYVGGVPPDGFTDGGQLWGNPVYDWPKHRDTNFSWWMRRFGMNLELFDVIRLDHFRGFDAFYAIEADATDGSKGIWIEGPGRDLFSTVKETFGDVKIIAENLGFITEDVDKLMEDTGYPGMAVIQFAWGGDDSLYLPHNVTKNTVFYTGTHDNQTLQGWLDTVEKKYLDLAVDYLKLTKSEGYVWGLIRGVWSSSADIAVAQMQDFLCLDDSARMNYPSTMGWWTWRVKKEDLTRGLSKKILDINKTYKRYELSRGNNSYTENIQKHKQG